MAWYVGVDFGAGLVDLSAHTHGVSKTQRLHSGLRSTVNTCSFRVDNATIANTFLTSDTYCPVTITKDAAAWFKGYVRPTFGAQVSAGLDSLEVECVDAGILLEKLVEDPVSYASYKVCDTTTKTASILHQLFYAAGISDSDLSLTTIDKTIACYAIDPAEKTTYWDAISELCFEHGYVFYVNNAGVFVLADLFPLSYSPGSLEDADVYHGLKVQKQERQYEAARVEWHPQTTLTNRVVFEDTTGGDGKLPCRIDLDPGGYYPEGAGTGDVYCEYRLDDYEIIKVTGAALKLSASGVATVTFTPGYKRALLKLYSASGGTIKGLLIRGNAVVRDLCQIRRSVRYVVPDSERVFEYAAKWILTAADAERLSNGIAKWYEFADYTYEFPTEEGLAPGSYWTLDESAVLGIATDIRVVEVTENEHGELHVSAEGMDEYTVTSASEQDSVGAGAPGVRIPFELNEDAESPYEGWEAIPDDSELFDLRQPDCVSSLGRKPYAKVCSFFPGKGQNQVGTEYNSPHAKFSGLGAVGTFVGTTNVVQSPEDWTNSTYWITSTATVSLSSEYFQDRRFSLVTAAGSSSGCVYQAFAPGAIGAAGSKSTTITIKKGSGNPRVGMYDWGVGWIFLAMVTWSTKTISFTSGSGTITHQEWWGDDIVELSITWTLTNAGNTHKFYAYGGTVDGNYNYYTAAQVESVAYATPYTPTTRANAGVVSWKIAAALTGTVEFWFRPWFNYDTGANRYVWLWGASASGLSSSVWLRYLQSGDNWEALIYLDGSNYRKVEMAAVASNAALWKWWHFKIIWDIPNQSIRMWVDGVEQTTTSSAGTVSGMTPQQELMQVGFAASAGANSADGLFADLLLQPGITTDTSVTHCTGGVPWYDPTEVANVVQSVRISEAGIRRHNAIDTWTDDRNRSIEISPAAGMLAKDAAGTVIHDIPTAPVLVGAYPMGHFYEFKHDDAAYTLVDSTTFGYTGGWQSGISVAMGGNSRISGIRARVYLTGSVSGGSAIPSVLASAALRPNGSGWTGLSTHMAPSGGLGISFSSSIVTFVTFECVLDVPVSASFLFDYAVEISPFTARRCVIQQLGVWI